MHPCPATTSHAAKHLHETRNSVESFSTSLVLCTGCSHTGCVAPLQVGASASPLPCIACPVPLARSTLSTTCGVHLHSWTSRTAQWCSWGGLTGELAEMCEPACGQIWSVLKVLHIGLCVPLYASAGLTCAACSAAGRGIVLLLLSSVRHSVECCFSSVATLAAGGSDQRACT